MSESRRHRRNGERPGAGRWGARDLGAGGAKELDALVRVHREPPCICCDNRIGLSRRAILKRANKTGVDCHRIEPTKPRQTAFDGSYYESLSEAFLTAAMRVRLQDVRRAPRAHEQTESHEPGTRGETKLPPPPQTLVVNDGATGGGQR